MPFNLSDNESSNGSSEGLAFTHHNTSVVRYRCPCCCEIMVRQKDNEPGSEEVIMTSSLCPRNAAFLEFMPPPPPLAFRPPPTTTRIFPPGLDLEAPPCLPLCTHPDCRRQNFPVFAAPDSDVPAPALAPRGVQRSGEILYLFNKPLLPTESEYYEANRTRDFLSLLGASTSPRAFDAYALTLSNPTQADPFQFWATPETDLRLWPAERIWF